MIIAGKVTLPLPVSTDECLELWKRLNGRLMTVAEKELYETLCRRLRCEIEWAAITVEKENPATCPDCDSARVIQTRGNRWLCKNCDSQFIAEAVENAS